ncbi:3311_t:CDS:1, partial [Racocetra persica]
RVPRAFTEKTVKEQEKIALQVSDYYSYFKAMLKGICNHFDTENASNNYIPNPIGHILHKILFSILSEHLDRRQFLTPQVYRHNKEESAQTEIQGRDIEQVYNIGTPYTLWRFLYKYFTKREENKNENTT